MNTHGFREGASPYQSQLANLARYNTWAHGELWRSLEPLPDDDYRRDVSLFFGSIHRTLNHILLAESLWLGRLKGEPFEISSLGQELEMDRAALRARMADKAQEIAAYVESLSEADLVGEFAYTSTSGAVFTRPRGPVLQHVFNHSTHHRGQISAALTQLGAPACEMDLLYYYDPDA